MTSTEAITDVTPAEAAVRLRKSYRFVMKLIDAGELNARDEKSPGATLPRWKIPISELERWRESRMRCAPTELDLRLKQMPSLASVLRLRRAARHARRSSAAAGGQSA